MLPVYFAQKAFVVNEGRLLAVRRNSNDLHNPLKWEVPGGRLEFGEEIDEHLEREVLEETGIAITSSEPFFIWKWNIRQQTPGAPSTIIAVARICSAASTKLSDSGRVAGDDLDLAEWIPLSQLHHYHWIPNMLPVIDAFLAKTGYASDH